MSDLNDLDLEDLMAELEAQNASIAEDFKPEPELPPTQETLAEEILDIDPAVMQPTAADHFNADQETQLAEAFTPPVEPELNVDEVMPETVEVEPIAEVKTTPVEAVQAEPEPEPEMTPAIAPEIEKRELNLKAEPQDDDEPSVNERSYKDAVKLKYEPNVTEFQVQTKITDANFDQCILDQASLMAYHSALYAQAEAQVARVKLKFETLEAGLYDAYRKRFLDMGEKVTEKAIENAVRLDKKWSKAKLLLIEAQTYADIHKGFVQSLNDRRFMLMSRGASLRDEMKGQLRVMAQVDPESPVNVQARAESNDMAARAMAIARGAFQRAG
ncbi:hypothetical protein WKH82_08390 [Acinetobacter baumannii]